MKHGDFYDSEQSHLITLSTTAPAAGAVAVGEAAITAAATDAAATTIPPAAVATAAAAPAKTYVKIEHTGMDGIKTILKDQIAVQEGEIVDASFMSVRALRSFLEEEMQVIKKTFYWSLSSSLYLLFCVSSQTIICTPLSHVLPY